VGSDERNSLKMAFEVLEQNVEPILFLRQDGCARLSLLDNNFVNQKDAIVNYQTDIAILCRLLLNRSMSV
jgi:hypothetical protein